MAQRGLTFTEFLHALLVLNLKNAQETNIIRLPRNFFYVLPFNSTSYNLYEYNGENLKILLEI